MRVGDEGRLVLTDRRVVDAGDDERDFRIGVERLTQVQGVIALLGRQAAVPQVRLLVRGQEDEVQALEGLDLASLAADEKTNLRYGCLAAEKGYHALDLGETFNADPKVPLIVAGVNDSTIRKDKPPLIANPHPATIIPVSYTHLTLPT